MNKEKVLKEYIVKTPVSHVQKTEWELPVYCEICNREFKNFPSFNTHKSKFHRGEAFNLNRTELRQVSTLSNTSDQQPEVDNIVDPCANGDAKEKQTEVSVKSVVDLVETAAGNESKKVESKRDRNKATFANAIKTVCPKVFDTETENGKRFVDGMADAFLNELTMRLAARKIDLDYQRIQPHLKSDLTEQRATECCKILSKITDLEQCVALSDAFHNEMVPTFHKLARVKHKTAESIGVWYASQNKPTKKRKSSGAESEMNGGGDDDDDGDDKEAARELITLTENKKSKTVE
jgi:hypothetical protein